ncbi:pentatricopeptide repeat-containing protein At2g21090-like [Chenopodium quinoa]|uniref:pentatricopeptide repeat-containing protein At2g21090-like n=1 Tax=Chenopodium quinoa TaxID=63459 RepID=UPI000B799697|nr:pentatricopeptide repeat-containing protein At2g21090-like [Chenopodium quinoa]
MPPFSQFQQKPRNLPCIVQPLIDLCYQGKLKEAINSLSILARKGLRLDSETLTLILGQCAKTRSRKEGRWVHLYMKATGMKHPSTIVSNYLMHMYFECGDHIEARKVFDKMSVRNVYSWNNVLSGYAKLGMLDAARRIFNKMTERDVVSWNTMVIGYAQQGKHSEAMRFYKEFRRESIGYNEFSFAGVLTIGIKLKDVVLTRQAHCQVLAVGFLPNLVISSSIADAYAKCGQLSDARRLFDEMQVRDIPAWTVLISGYCKWGDMKSAQELFNAMPAKNPVSWTAMVSGYARNNSGYAALKLFHKMMNFRIRPDQFTFSSALNACASLATLKHGKQIHAYMIRTCFRPNNVVVSSLIDMYSKCGSLKLSQQVFRLMGIKEDVMSWNPTIGALAQHGYGEEAIKMFDEMLLYGVRPNRVTLVVILSACSHSGLVDQGLAIFESMTDDHDISPDAEHYACLVDLLGRAGRFDELMKQLEKVPCKDDDRILNSLIGVCQIQENVELGKRAAEHLIKQDLHSYAPYLLLSTIHAASGEWESVEKIRQLMDQRGARKEKASSWVETNNKVHSLNAQ